MSELPERPLYLSGSRRGKTYKYVIALEQRLAAAEKARDEFKARTEAVYEAGWRMAAVWANRRDLWFDTGSPRYMLDRDTALKEVVAAGLPVNSTTEPK